MQRKLLQNMGRKSGADTRKESGADTRKESSMKESVESTRASDEGQSSRETVTAGVGGLSLEQTSNLEQQP